MTKKLLLTAAALGAMAFAGAASAGNITSATISTTVLGTTPVGTSTKVKPYLVANEATLSAPISSTPATSNVAISLDSPVAISAGAKVPFAVVFTISGPGEFGATPAFSSLKGVESSTVEAPAASGVVVLSTDKKTLSFFVEMGQTAALNVNSLRLDNLTLKVSEKAQVSIAAEAKVTVAGFTQVVSVVEATPVVAFANVLKPATPATYTAIAALSDYKSFKVDGVADAAGSATVSKVVSNPVALTANADIRKNLIDTAVLNVASIVSGASAVVTGPQVKDLVASFASVNIDKTLATTTATSATFSGITPANLVVATNAGSLTLLNPGAPDTKVIEQGTYAVELKPTFQTGFASTTLNQTLNMIKVDLAGTNFTAPWFALDNGTANSTLRLANNGSAPVGPIMISLKANNGTAATTGTHTIASIPAGSFVAVRGDVLKAAFGTDAGNGDLQITIQSDIANVSAKVRTSQSTGQIFENSLGNGSDALTK